MKEMEQRDRLNELALQAKSGEKSALDELLTAPQIQGIIYKTAIEKVGQSHSDDIYQRVSITIWKKIHTWQGESKITSWIKRVTFNDCIDFLRSTKPQKLIFTDQPLEGEVRNGPTEHILEQEKYEALTRALQTIGELCQHILTAFLLEGKDKKAIMELVGLKKSTFYDRFNHCCENLQHSIQKIFQESGK